MGEKKLPRPIPEHPPNKDCEYLKEGMCYWCCGSCNYDTHTCLGCGTPLDHNSKEYSGEDHPVCIDDAPDNPAPGHLEAAERLMDTAYDWDGGSG